MVVVVHERSSPVKGFSYSDLTEKFFITGILKKWLLMGDGHL